jgi:hypothetical protein
MKSNQIKLEENKNFTHKVFNPLKNEFLFLRG